MWKICLRSRSRSKCLRYLLLKRSYSIRGAGSQSGDADSKVVELSVGKVKGRWQVGLYGDGFYSFEGIPFAKPPLGDLRFVAPVPADPWNHELDARQEKFVPLQSERMTGQVIGSEDCLYLNVYTKHVSTSNS